MNTHLHHKIILYLFYLTVVMSLLDVLDYLLFPDLTEHPLFLFLYILLPALLVVLHSSLAFGLRRCLLFLVICAGIGFGFELLAVNFIGAFGNNYVYRNALFLAGAVPLLIPLFWAVFIYTGYIVVSTFLLWTKQPKPHRSNGKWYLLPILIILDAFVVLAIDLVMDPVIVNSPKWKLVSWIWEGSGDYYGVPLGNFLGWFTVTALCTAVFRIYEYLSPIHKTSMKRSYFVLPVFGYGLLMLGFIINALEASIPVVAMVGASIAIPVVCINILMFLQRNKKRLRFYED